MRKILIICTLLVFCLGILPWTAWAAEQPGKLTVGAGQSRTMTLYGLQKAAIANPDVLDVLFPKL